jgi:E3 ubiquitin-protein ligase RHA2
LFSRAFAWRRVGGYQDDFAVVKEGRMKQRLEEINTRVKTQNFGEWLASQKEHHSKSLYDSDSLW